MILLTLSLLFLLLTTGVAAAADFGLGIYASRDLCFSGKYNLSPDVSIQGLISGNSLGIRGLYKLAKDANYNFFGYGEFGFVNKEVAASAGFGIEFFVFKALKVRELSRLGFSLDFGMNILPDTGFDFGGGFHYYF